MRKYIYLSTAMILALCTWLAYTTFVGRPLSIDWFFFRVTAYSLLDDPQGLSSVRLLDKFGVDFFEDELTDISDATVTKDYKQTAKNKEILLQYKREDLTEDQKLSYDIMLYLLESRLEGEKYRYNNYPVNQLFGEQSDLPDFMVNTHNITNEKTAKSYLKRLKHFPDKMGQIINGMKIRKEKGVVPPAFVIDRVITEVEGFLAPAPNKHFLFINFKEKTDTLSKIDNETKVKLTAEVEKVIADKVYPTYNDLLIFLKTLKAVATNDDGVWKLPDGDAYYNYVLKQQTTTNYTATQIHDIGLSEVARIQGEMRHILDSLGYAKKKPLATILRGIAMESKQLYPNTDSGRAECLKDYATIIADIEKGLKPYFDIVPKAKVEVKRIPLFKEATAPGAYYYQPAFDGSRPGVFYANLRDMREVPKMGMRTLSYHEAVPGHHFQIALQQEQAELPLFRKLTGFTAYVEGWALYAERLAFELGYEKDPYDNLGRLQAELFRAVRLVVDTGIHNKRWTREEAIKYMAENTGMPIGDVTAEIERYIVMPGQACAYKMGMIEMLKLRVEASSKRGFTMPAFHNCVLQTGSVPLFVLDKVVSERFK